MRNFDLQKSQTLFRKYAKLLTQAQRQALELYLIKRIPTSEIAKIIAATRQAAHDSVRKGLEKLQEINDKIEPN